MKFRPRFSLKVLMLLVAAIGIFCAYHVNWIRQRHAFLEKYAANARENDLLADKTQSGRNDVAMFISGAGIIVRKTPKRTFNLLWLFGEPRCQQVRLVYRLDLSNPTNFPASDDFNWALKHVPPDESDLAERLFPEADIAYVIYGVQEK